MGATLPEIPRLEFFERLERLGTAALADAAGHERLYAHYEELRRWNPTLSLVGPGTAAEIVERHYGESLAALPSLEGVKSLVDLGSGAGFPGFVLAACRPEIDVTLVEARGRKCAFLAAAARRARLSIRCLNVRVSVPLPPSFPGSVDLYTSRALRLPENVLVALDARLTGRHRWIFWSTPSALERPTGAEVVQTIPLDRSTQRALFILEARRPDQGPR